MYYTIYFNQKPLVLTDNKTAKVAELLTRSTTVFQERFTDESIDAILEAIQQPGATGGIILHHSAETVLDRFKKKLKRIEAGGGLVHTINETVLLIFRNGKWDLPKGKLDVGEAVAAAAVREVHEETGLEQLELEEPLTTTYHTYYQNDELILKESHWFLMKSPQQQAMVPQLEEGIEKCEWVKMDALAPYLENTHPSVIDVLQLGLQKLRAQQKF